ncbi:hypothetical protein BCD06_004848 [Escherichia coli]|nr:hypothetical protein [Escherichia coli]EEV7035829.1 hypothetical protein [Escherichia coli]EEV7055255.1 hypothetical protein [Escherichia coli]EGA0336300.1 hypothetical protein [Escherichia coli]MBZ9219892.1 hypothetical protein [Escherichia coli]
MRFVYNSILR